MSVVSVEFLVFLICVLIVYYAVPKKVQWLVMLLSSYCFYFMAGVLPLVFVMATTVVVYSAGLWMRRISLKAENRKQAKTRMKRVLVLTIIIIFGTLLIFKYYNFIAENINGLLTVFRYDPAMPMINVILPLGISFYMFQAIGYCIDVYRGKIKAERSLMRFAMFISFFPQATQGPISKYDDLGTQLSGQHRLSYDNITKGAQLMLWGFVKKMVIADRLAAPVGEVFDHYQGFDGMQTSIAIILYALQIYADFSGGIDIIRGSAQCMGINLMENFKRPYFGNSVAEYWRRWHISLTSWMRDYVFYSLALSKMSGKIGKWSRKHVRMGTIGKQIPAYIPTFVTFFLIGIWHGAGWGFIVFGLYNATIIVLAMVFTDVFNKLNSLLGIDTGSLSWRVWQIIRTFAIMAIGKCITRAPDVSTGIEMVRTCFSDFRITDFLQQITGMGMNGANWTVTACSLALFLIVSIMQEAGLNVRDSLSRQILPVRWIIYMSGVVVIILFGVYGPGYDAASFIYRGF